MKNIRGRPKRPTEFQFMRILYPPGYDRPDGSPVTSNPAAIGR